MGERCLNMRMRAYSHMRTSLATDLFGMLYSVIPEGKITDKEQTEDHAPLEGDHQPFRAPEVRPSVNLGDSQETRVDLERVDVPDVTPEMPMP